VCIVCNHVNVQQIFIYKTLILIEVSLKTKKIKFQMTVFNLFFSIIVSNFALSVIPSLIFHFCS